MAVVEFVKGQGTLNDFVLFADPDDQLRLTDAQVSRVCHRRAGIGADGILRAVRGRHIPGWAGDPGIWFMDYRNADGSVAEMCGNGLRVFARFLLTEGLSSGSVIQVGTRAGLRTAEQCSQDQIEVSMGEVRIDPRQVSARIGQQRWWGTPVEVGNPHLVCQVDSAELAALDLSVPPVVEPAGRFPQGVNVEFYEVLAPDAVRMRVHERGSGETWSCGTGVVATAAVALPEGLRSGPVRVEVPGGTLRVRAGGGFAWLRGPAELVARGTIELEGDR